MPPATCHLPANAPLPSSTLPLPSFGMILYELLHRKMVVADLMYLGSAAEAEAFAFKVQGCGLGWPWGTAVCGRTACQLGMQHLVLCKASQPPAQLAQHP